MFLLIQNSYCVTGPTFVWYDCLLFVYLFVLVVVFLCVQCRHLKAFLQRVSGLVCQCYPIPVRCNHRAGIAVKQAASRRRQSLLTWPRRMERADGDASRTSCRKIVVLFACTLFLSCPEQVSVLQKDSCHYCHLKMDSGLSIKVWNIFPVTRIYYENQMPHSKQAMSLQHLKKEVAVQSWTKAVVAPERKTRFYKKNVRLNHWLSVIALYDFVA